MLPFKTYFYLFMAKGGVLVFFCNIINKKNRDAVHLGFVREKLFFTS